MKIVKYDDTSFTSENGDPSSVLQWVRMDPNQYFLVLAGRSGVSYNRGGPTPILIKSDDGRLSLDAVGTYFVGGKPCISAQLRRNTATSL